MAKAVKKAAKKVATKKAEKKTANKKQAQSENLQAWERGEAVKCLPDESETV